MNVTLDETLIATVRDGALTAGEAIMAIYATDFEVIQKSDESPVTAADKAAEAIITPILKSIAPSIPVVAEEAFSEGQVPDISGGTFWLVDPLDGTKQFITKKGEFTVNIALIVDRRPVFGVVHAPALNQTYVGGPQGATLAKNGEPAQVIKCRPAPSAGIVAVASRSHRTPEVDTFLADYAVAEEISSGSSIKFCLVASGRADLYPRFGRTMEWDTAAGHAVLSAAGGTVKNIDGTDFLYAKDGFANPGFIARGIGVA
ncbi:MAG: 3'(2'),5'-bisphosphate nucleotidase CysQ [Magnetospiraceae bacterium]